MIGGTATAAVLGRPVLSTALPVALNCTIAAACLAGKRTSRTILGVDTIAPVHRLSLCPVVLHFCPCLAEAIWEHHVCFTCYYSGAEEVAMKLRASPPDDYLNGVLGGALAGAALGALRGTGLQYP